MNGVVRSVGVILDGFGVLARGLAVALIWGYRLLVKPLFPATCRFDPSCSEYALQAVRRFGTLRGGWLAARRLGRCHPWGDCGADPVPEHWPAGGRLAHSGRERR